jgi:hypothetical protein
MNQIVCDGRPQIFDVSWTVCMVDEDAGVYAWQGGMVVGEGPATSAHGTLHPDLGFTFMVTTLRSQ